MWLLYLVVVFIGVTLSGFLWAYGGASGTSLSWRRIGVPVVLTVIVATFTHVWLLPLISGVVLYIMTTLPYGISDKNDEGGVIGRFWYKRFGSENTANFFTRLTVGLCYSLSYIPLVLIKGHIGYILVPILLNTANVVYWGAIAEDQPPIFIVGLQLNGEEFKIGCGVALCGFLALL